MRKDQTDPVGWLFEQAVAEGHRLDLGQHWPSLFYLYAMVCCEDEQGQDNRLQKLIRCSKAGLEQSPAVCGLLPREYERLLLSIERLQEAVDEFGDAVSPVMNRVEVTPYVEPTDE